MCKKTEIDDPTEAFEALTKKALTLGLTPRQIANLDSVKQLRAPNRTWLKIKDCIRPMLWPMLTALVVCWLILFSVWLAEWPVSRKTILTPWFELLDTDVERELCVLEVPEVLLDLTRPPVDCAICRDVTSVDKVSKITPQQFEAKYAYSGLPLVVMDATKNWTALETFSFDFFKNVVYTEDSPALQSVEQNCQFFPYKTDFYSLGEVFNMSTDRAQMKDGSEPWYIGWSNCDSSAANILRQHYQKPYFLPEVAESSKTDWIFMGSPGYGAHMHIDNVGNPSWQAQIRGVKLWTLEPPPECYHECVPKIEITVNPGEIIVLDTNRWYHSTLILGNEMSIVITTEYD